MFLVNREIFFTPVSDSHNYSHIILVGHFAIVKYIISLFSFRWYLIIYIGRVQMAL